MRSNEMVVGRPTCKCGILTILTSLKSLSFSRLQTGFSVQRRVQELSSTKALALDPALLDKQGKWRQKHSWAFEVGFHKHPDTNGTTRRDYPEDEVRPTRAP